MRTFLLILFLATFLGSGCVSQEDSISIYISPNGSVELIHLMDNIHSTKTGEKKIKEEGKWLTEFRLKKLSEQKKADTSYLLKDSPPFSAVVKAVFPDIRSFGAYFDLNTKETSNTVTFSRKGKKRELVFHIITGKKPREQKKPDRKKSSLYPLIKFIPAEGKITDSFGFTVSKDKDYAFLDLAKVDVMEKSKTKYTLYLHWTITK